VVGVSGCFYWSEYFARFLDSCLKGGRKGLDGGVGVEVEVRGGVLLSVIGCCSGLFSFWIV